MPFLKNIPIWVKPALVAYLSMLIYYFFFRVPTIFENSLDALKNSGKQENVYLVCILLFGCIFSYAACNSNIPPHTYPS
jgi:hypothetical protein